MIKKTTNGWEVGDIDSAKTIIRKIISDYCFDPPKLGITGDGELQAEWKIGNFSLDLQFNFNDHEVYLLATQVGTLNSTETVFNFLEEQDVMKLMHTLLKYDSRRGWDLND